MRLVLNGESKEFPEGATVDEIVRSYAGRPDGSGLAVALNGEVVRRAEWSDVHLNEEDHVEVLRAIGGGAS
jgi:sulfur carrier protein